MVKEFQLHSGVYYQKYIFFFSLLHEYVNISIYEIQTKFNKIDTYEIIPVNIKYKSRFISVELH